jgi:hypothetical protein
MRRVLVILVAGSSLLLCGAAQQPRALAQTSGGLWEISGLPAPASTLRQCIRNTAVLARIEHRGGACTQVLIEDGPSTAVIHYTCARGGFGQSKLTALTPRSLRIETQGISGDLPFNYLLQARRIGNCTPH